MDNQPTKNLLEVSRVDANYQGIISALRNVTLMVPERSIVSLLGANGAGKTTTLKAISGLLQLDRGNIARGTVTYEDQPIHQLPAEALVKRGIVQVLEGRRCFTQLTVEENLLVSAQNQGGSKAGIAKDMDMIFEFFPNLRKHRNLKAGFISGGEQQMLAISRALLAKPKLLLLDEPSMGLAPQIVSQIFEILETLNREMGITILLAEQNARIALRYAHYGYILSNGTVLMSGTSQALSESDDVRNFYLGISDEGNNATRSNSVASRENRWMY